MSKLEKSPASTLNSLPVPRDFALIPCRMMNIWFIWIDMASVTDSARLARSRASSAKASPDDTGWVVSGASTGVGFLGRDDRDSTGWATGGRSVSISILFPLSYCCDYDQVVALVTAPSSLVWPTQYQLVPSQ